MFSNSLINLSKISWVLQLKQNCAESPFGFTALILIISSFIICFANHLGNKTKVLLYVVSFSITITFILILHLRWDSYSIFEIHKIISEKIPPKSIHFIGDSHTAHGILPMGFLSKIKSVMPNTKISQESYSGYTISKIFEALDKKKFNAKNSEVTVIFAGTNDSVQGIPKTDSIEGMKKILSLESKRSAEIFVIIPHSVDVPKIKQNCSSLSQALRALSSFHNFKLIDWYKNSYNKGFCSNDRIHLNATGHSALAKLFLKTIPQK